MLDQDEDNQSQNNTLQAVALLIGLSFLLVIGIPGRRPVSHHHLGHVLTDRGVYLSWSQRPLDGATRIVLRRSYGSGEWQTIAEKTTDTTDDLWWSHLDSSIEAKGETLKYQLLSYKGDDLHSITYITKAINPTTAELEEDVAIVEPAHLSHLAKMFAEIASELEKENLSKDRLAEIKKAALQAASDSALVSLSKQDSELDYRIKRVWRQFKKYSLHPKILRKEARSMQAKLQRMFPKEARYVYALSQDRS